MQKIKNEYLPIVNHSKNLELKTGLELLTNQIHELKDKNTSLCEELSSLKEKVAALIVIPSSDTTTISICKVLSEISERKRCCLNVNVNRIPEST